MDRLARQWRSLALIILVMTIGIRSQAQVLEAIKSPTTRQQYCSMVKNKDSFIHLLDLQESRLAFQNPGGFFNTGLCWWHSRLQRASLYLAIYQPKARRAPASQVLSILDSLYNERGIVVISGYKNFYEFTSANTEVIENYLATSQVLDAIQGEWIDGLIGTSTLPANQLRNLMDRLYQQFSNSHDIQYEMLQMPGVVAHAWLIHGIQPNGNGYDLRYVDSNFPLESRNYRYSFGDTTLDYNGITHFVPYTRDQDRLARVWQIANAYCK